MPALWAILLHPAMTPSPKLALAGFFALSAFSDVAPRCDCGGRREPTVIVKQVGEHCGWEGPRRRLECAAPAQCMRLSGGEQLCASACETDNDCSKHGAGFVCTSKARAYESDPNAKETSICKREAADAGRFAPPPPSNAPKGIDPG